MEAVTPERLRISLGLDREAGASEVPKKVRVSATTFTSAEGAPPALAAVLMVRGLPGSLTFRMATLVEESRPSTRYSLPFFLTNSIRVTGPPESWTWATTLAGLSAVLFEFGLA